MCFLSNIVEPLYDDPRGGVVPPPPIAIWEELEGAGQHAKNLSTLIKLINEANFKFLNKYSVLKCQNIFLVHYYFGILSSNFNKHHNCQK